MANIPIKPWELPAGTPVANASIVGGNGAVVQKYTPAQIVDVAAPLASQEDAESGTGNDNRMSSLRVKQAIDAQVLDPLAAPTGGDLIGFSHSASYAAGTTGAELQRQGQIALNAEASVWRKRPVADAGLRFPDYNAARAFIGGTYLYPQGFDFDDAGRIYLYSKSNATSTHSVVVVYDADFNYLGYFYRPIVGGESIVVTGDPAAGTLKLYFTYNGSLTEHAPGTMPASGSILSSGTTVLSGCASIFGFNEGVWLIQQSTADLGITTSRTAFNFYNTDFEPIGRFFVDKNVVGWQTSDDSSEHHFVPKMQGITHRRGKVYISTGGSYIPEVQPDGPPRSANCGIIEVTLGGLVTQYGVCEPDGIISRMTELGYSIERTENEGIAVGPDGELYSLLVTKRPGTADSWDTGLVLMQEMALFGDSWADIPSPYRPASLARYSGRIWPRSADGEMRSPISGVAITTMAELLTLMVDMQLPDVSYFTSVHNLTRLAGLPSTESWRVDLLNLNNSTIHCRMTSTTSHIQQWFRLARSGGVWGAIPISQAADVSCLIDGVTAPATRAGYASLYVDAADGDLKVKFGDGTTKTIVTDS